LRKIGNGLTTQALRKPQCFKDIGGLLLFSVAPSENRTKLDAELFQTDDLSGVSQKMQRVNSAPIRRRSLVEEESTHVIVGRHGSYRADWSGNWPGRSLGTKSALGGRAILQAITRVKGVNWAKARVRAEHGMELIEQLVSELDQLLVRRKWHVASLRILVRILQQMRIAGNGCL
jgi:hypothetical protein